MALADERSPAQDWRTAHMHTMGREVPTETALGLAFVAHLSASSRVLTRKGFKRIDDVNETVEVWTGAEWAEAHIRPTAHTHAKYRVELSNGQHITCGARQTWALNEDNTLVSRPTTDLHSQDRLFPFTLPYPEGDSLDLIPTCELKGRRAEQQTASKQHSAIESRFGNDRDCVLSFISGWINAQGGHLMAKDAKGASLLILLLEQASVGPCRVSEREVFIPAAAREMFAVDPESACFIHTRPRSVRVLSIEMQSRTRTTMYHVWFASSPTAQSILVGTSLMLVPNMSHMSNPISPPSPDSHSSEGASGDE